MSEAGTRDAPGVRVFLASENVKKIAEMERILRRHLPEIEVLGIKDVAGYPAPVEDEPTFSGNALLKARAGVAATGLPSLADDSGLCVDALNEMPGVLSARWAGRAKSDDDNNRLLLEQLHDVPDERRGAHFTCAAVLVHPDGSELVVEGRMDGRIVRECRGDGGFGYDVVFEPQQTPGRTAAEASPEEKDAISHRGKALRELAPAVAAKLG